MEVVQYKNLQFQVWDLGGQNSIRFLFLIIIGNIGKCIILILMPYFMLLIVMINLGFLRLQNN